MDNYLEEMIVSLPPNHCPSCGEPLIMVDSEMRYTVFDNTGEAIDVEVMYYRCEGICNPCNRVFNYRRYGTNYIPYDHPIAAIIRAKIQMEEYMKELE